MDIYDYYQSLSRPQRSLFRIKVTKEAEISDASFYKKMPKKAFTKAEIFFIENLIRTASKSWGAE